MQFQKIINQKEAKSHLLHSVNAGKLPHALLICGSEGVGKLAFAVAIAQYMNCLNPTETDSCGTCANCQKISQGIHPDVHYILPIISSTKNGRALLTEDYFEEFRTHFFSHPYYGFEEWQQSLDGDNKQLMISVHEMREAKRKLSLKSFEGKSKVLIIWNIEKMRVEGANAFLKLLEEPPEKTLILMTCTDPNKILTTINSRCQRVYLNRLSPDDIETYLLQYKNIDEGRAREIARIADGNIQNAKAYSEAAGQSLHDAYVKWLRAVYRGSFNEIVHEIEPVFKSPKEFQKSFVRLAIKQIRDSFLFHLSLDKIAFATEEEAAFHRNFAKLLNPSKSERILTELENALRYITGNANAQLVFTALSLKIYIVLREN
ncbi:MAG: DNA polymerase III subunit delta' [Bacteroidia bacterium]|nr:DNA polymerase III subunit delta' [Bacteroidia bacterium]